MVSEFHRKVFSQFCRPRVDHREWGFPLNAQGSRRAREIFLDEVLEEIVSDLPRAGMWLWPILNLIDWGERTFV